MMKEKIIPYKSSSKLLFIILGIILMFGLVGIICIGIILAKGSQEHIDYMNDRIRQDQKWRNKQ